MKIVFIENRQKTYFWAAVAEKMRQRGHVIGWLVQNLQFEPSFGDIRRIPYPGRVTASIAPSTTLLQGVATADRNILYFGGTDAHYCHYANQIDQNLQALAPDLLIGESTLFHELIVIRWARAHGVPYLHPTSPGYPRGRFVVYEGDTKSPRGGSGETLDDASCDALIDAIASREVVPDYMKMVDKQSMTVNSDLPKPDSVRARLEMLYSYLRGERFNTPSPLRRLALDAAKRRHLQTWRQLAHLPEGGFESDRFLLYPLQMQPEANIDVWGNRYRDQAALIRAIATSLPPGVRLLVKANPKAKLELSEPLMTALQSDSRILPLPVDIPMGDVLPYMDGVITVTGTVAIECVLTCRPVLILGPSIVAGLPGVIDGSDGPKLSELIRALSCGEAGIATRDDHRRLVRRLMAKTYPGLVSDPRYEPGCIDAENAARVGRGLLHSVTEAA